MGDRVARAAQPGNKFTELCERAFERSDVGQLTADVYRDAAQVHAFLAGKLSEDLPCLINRHAKLVVGLARRNLVMRSGIDVRIDSQRAICGQAHSFRDFGQLQAFFFALDVELTDPGFKRLDHFAAGLSHTREDDHFRSDTCGQRAAHFANGNDIGTIPLVLQHFQYSQIGIGFDRKRNQLVRHFVQCFSKNACMPFQRCA